MKPQFKEEIYKDFRIQYQFIETNNKFEGRPIIHGNLCSSATTTSTKSDLCWYKFNSFEQTQNELEKMAHTRIDNAQNYHSSEKICAFCGHISS